ncbi:MAG: outer membrane protein transport protein [Alphaproteobacteria bacterium]|nr:outer membrane protein transport protein [Alphaproteobacteria bacterium]
MTIKHIAYSLLCSSFLFSVTQAAHAAGFYIQEQSVKGLGSAFSGSTTSIEDASTIYFNPAGMTKLEQAQINAGVHLIVPSADLTDTGSTLGGAPVTGGDGGNPYSPTPIPNLYAAVPLNNMIWAGIGVSAPFGLGSDYGDTWFGRFDSTQTDLTTINIQPSVAVKANDWLSIGGGVDIQYADAELKSAAQIVTAGESKLKGDDWSLGYNIGVLVKPLPQTEFGVHYRSAIEHTLDGRISLQGTGAGTFDIPGTADLNLPDIATFGVAHDVNENLRLNAQVTWFGWNNFQEIRAKNAAGGTVSNVTQNYSNTTAFAVGGEYDLNDTWTVRAGYQFDETPTNDQFRTTRTPDGDRNWFSGGGTYKLNENIDLDFAATYIHVGSETINVSGRNALGNAVVRANTGGDIGIVAVGLNYKF